MVFTNYLAHYMSVELKKSYGHASKIKNCILTGGSQRTHTFS